MHLRAIQEIDGLGGACEASVLQVVTTDSPTGAKRELSNAGAAFIVRQLTVTTAPTTHRMDATAVRHRLLQNSLLVGLSRLLSMCTALISVPIIVAKLGLTGYGGWEVLMAIAAISTSFQTIISGTLVWKMSAAYGNDNPSEIERLARIGIGVTLGLFFLICPAVWVMRSHLVDVSKVPALYRAVALWVLPWLVTQLSLGGVGEVFGAMLISHQRAGVMTLIQSGAVIANNAFVIFFQ